jgi:hypothetical protein
MPKRMRSAIELLDASKHVSAGATFPTAAE